ncbi:MAG: signal peptidase I [Gallionellales bacterium 35-53-114]|jgi:signal peptidase I|nr:MAG: signal peptidase I [Gallionellales bacterium 35-53-114]OYZ63173.1 MAG: signal peptidase I [Gallionellales bacterium 24-53-125]OZB08639.1 MAG: signal peptidase I [Gallionellales bacterium 39-52-133]HQS57506.1 signal peptidase I [Gallionellaceae bacterium]HQS74306.1 signal peptidase I [Gallionellaceae bacterium]
MDFALIMFSLLVLTGSIWLLDRLILQGKRTNKAEPWWVEYAKSFFPVILAVFVLRSFLVEPFKIPSGSMIPTLHVGDFILVNKFTYGIRLPIINQKIVQINNPARGDVMVFHYPENPSIDYIKRIVGLPGDVIVYRNKQLLVNGEVQQQKSLGEYNYVDNGLSFVHTSRYTENLSGGRSHEILINPDVPGLHMAAVADFPQREQCSYSFDEVRCTVPAGHYFAMGDNRDNSRDSRYWGFVPDKMIVGKAFFIWMNFSDFKRIGLTIN